MTDRELLERAAKAAGMDLATQWAWSDTKASLYRPDDVHGYV